MPIRWGIIGCGDVCEIKSGPGFQKATDSELVAVMRRNAELAQDYAARHEVPRWYDDADELLNDPEVDAVYVASPPGSHVEVGLKVGAAGKPCLMEKPMARNVPECRSLMDAFAQADAPLFVAYYRRALPRFVKVQEMLADLGDVTGVEYRFTQPPWQEVDPNNLPWRVVPEISGGGLFLDLGCHALDLIDHLVGPLRCENATATNTGGQYQAEDRVEFRCVTGQGAMVNGLFDFQADGKADLLTLTAERGSISVPCFDNGPITFSPTDGDTRAIEVPHPAHVHQPLIQSVVDEILGRGTCPSLAESAIRASELMDAMLDDYYGGRSRAFWE